MLRVIALLALCASISATPISSISSSTSTNSTSTSTTSTDSSTSTTSTTTTSAISTTPSTTSTTIVLAPTTVVVVAPVAVVAVQSSTTQAAAVAKVSVVATTPAYVPLTAAQEAKNLNAAIAALIVEKAIDSLLNAPKTVIPATTVPIKVASQYSTGGSTNVLYNCANQGQFAMTFDDGPYVYNQQIANVFNPSGSKATFFVNGNNYYCIYDRAADIIARLSEGHQIASHTWGHDSIVSLSADALNNQITLVETALWKIAGIRPAFFRPPYGNYDDRTIAILASRGYTTVIWSDDDGDSTGSSVQTSLQDYENIYPTYPAPHNVLNHETYANTANYIVPVVVPKLLSAGWKLVTVATCVNKPAYQAPINYGGSPGVRDSSWTCSGTPAPGAP